MTVDRARLRADAENAEGLTVTKGEVVLGKDYMILLAETVLAVLDSEKRLADALRATIQTGGAAALKEALAALAEYEGGQP